MQHYPTDSTSVRIVTAATV